MKASTIGYKQRSIAALSTHHKNYIGITYVLSKPLQPSEVSVLNLFKLNLGQPIDTYIFKKHGITSIHQCIYRLKKKGAVIQTDYSAIADNSGVIRNRVASYSLKGWFYGSK